MEEPQFNYRAFISYSQKDKAKAKRIHRALENYRIPVGIGAQLTSERKLGRVFQDEEELGGSAALGATLEGALQESENLIVLCSPNSAKSRWVDMEIRTFRKLRDPNRVFAVIIDGKINVAELDDPEQAELECLPPAFRGIALDGSLDHDGNPQPLAPDWRKEDFERLKTRIVSAILNVNFDELWNRHKRRYRKRLRLFVAGSIALMISSFTTWLWSDLINWKGNLADRAILSVTSAKKLIQEALNSNAEDGEGEFLAFDALNERRRAARYAIAALSRDGMLARTAEYKVQHEIWSSGIVSEEIMSHCSEPVIGRVEFSRNSKQLIIPVANGLCIHNLKDKTSRAIDETSARTHINNGFRDFFGAAERADRAINTAPIAPEPDGQKLLERSPGRLHSIGLAENGQIFLTLPPDGMIGLWDGSNVRSTSKYPVSHGKIEDISSDGQQALVIEVNGEETTLKIWHVSSHAMESSTISTRLLAGAFSNTGRSVITVGSDWTVRQYHSLKLQAMGEPIKLRDAPSHLLVSAAITKGTYRIVTVEFNGGPAQVWNLEGELVAEVWSPDEWFDTASLSPDGSVFVTTARNGEVRTWPLRKGNALTASELRSELCKRLEPRDRLLHTEDGWWLALRLLPADPCEWHGLGDRQFWRNFSTTFARLTEGLGAAKPSTEYISQQGFDLIDYKGL